jgi:hypothetical protein
MSLRVEVLLLAGALTAGLDIGGTQDQRLVRGGKFAIGGHGMARNMPKPKGKQSKKKPAK